MRRLILLLSVIIMLTSCSVVKRTYVRDYGERIELIKTNFPEIYDLYRRGSSLLTMYILMKKMAKNEWAFIIITDKSIKQT